MNSPEEREALLRALACGELHPGSPDVVARLAADPELALRYESLRALAGRLDRSALEQREVLRDAAGWPDPQPAGESARALRRLVREGAGDAQPAHAAPRGRMWMLAAAIVLVVGAAAVFFARDRAPRHGAGEVLGTRDGVTLIAPDDHGRWDAATGFRWSYDLPEGDQFEVVVEAAGQDATEFEIVHPTRATTWIPTETERAGWPKQARWSVRVRRGADGTTDLFSAWRAVSFE